MSLYGYRYDVGRVPTSNIVSAPGGAAPAGWVIVNSGYRPVYLGGAAVTTSIGSTLWPGRSWTVGALDSIVNDDIHAITGTGVSGEVRVLVIKP